MVISENDQFFHAWDKMMKKLPKISCTKTSALRVTDLEQFRMTDGTPLSVKKSMLLCRCGASKPFCDGSHVKIGFSGEKKPNRKVDRAVQYKGKDIIIVDNHGVCSHNGACWKNSPDVFQPSKFKWIKPDAASREEIISTIEKCPSGALSYIVDGVRQQNLGREPAIIVDPEGPFEVVGYIELIDDMGSVPESEEHYTLCRCGLSRNMPFCDGMHLPGVFEKDKESKK